ncbi:hypothetical protein K466DRAFT_592957 [Polyporus arcularius HHB13444]|uniref:Uncharacterized protein n=1 Tax=Polyporus arcularius HHB13444 TaxID=1314778 RepID=A0A5C3NPQ0_9APHY|nr:hypothetical protein K466DRAFT_592957 [Polyporus arcularius HHB13444]
MFKLLRQLLWDEFASSSPMRAPSRESAALRMGLAACPSPSSGASLIQAAVCRRALNLLVFATKVFDER